MTDPEPTTWHLGRSFTDHRLEDACPCPKAPCGLVTLETASPDCQAGHDGSRTIRQSHPSDRCPAAPGFLDDLETIALAAVAQRQHAIGPAVGRLIERRMLRRVESEVAPLQVTEYGAQVIHALAHARREAGLPPLG